MSARPLLDRRIHSEPVGAREVHKSSKTSWQRYAETASYAQLRRAVFEDQRGAIPRWINGLGDNRGRHS